MDRSLPGSFVERDFNLVTSTLVEVIKAISGNTNIENIS